MIPVPGSIYVIYSAIYRLPGGNFDHNRLGAHCHDPLHKGYFQQLSVAVLANYFIPGLTLAPGFLLGGIVSPPDAVSAGAIMKFVKLPKSTAAVQEGESLLNDASSLLIFKFALVAVGTGQFIFRDAMSGLLLANVKLIRLIWWRNAVSCYKSSLPVPAEVFVAIGRSSCIYNFLSKRHQRQFNHLKMFSAKR